MSISDTLSATIRNIFDRRGAEVFLIARKSGFGRDLPALLYTEFAA